MIKKLLPMILVLALSSAAYAQSGKDLPTNEPIVVNGDKVEYFPDKKMATGEGNISINYKDVNLVCDKIVVYLDTHEAIAEGNVKVTQKDSYFTGDKINYNFDTRKGTVIEGYVNSKPFYGKAKEVEKVAGKEEYRLQAGYATTCDFEKPHYRIQAKEVKIYMGDKVVAKNIVVYAGDLPVFYVPYYVQPLRDTKQYFNVITGESEDWGYYALGTYRQYIDDNHQSDVLFDYRSKKGPAIGINTYYRDEDVGNGTFKVYYAGESTDVTYEDVGIPQKRYRYQWRHKWDMKEYDTTAITEFNLLKDTAVIKDYFYNEYQELGDQPDNYVTFTTSKPQYSTQLLARKRFNKFYTVVERLPEYYINVYNWQMMKDIPAYYSGNLGGVYLNKTFDNVSTNVQNKDVNVVRFDSYNRFSYAARLFRSLSVAPFWGTDNTYYSRNRWGGTNQIRTFFDAGFDSSIKFYKIYGVTTNFMDININNIRHVITPTAGYYYRVQPTIDTENLQQFDGLDTIGKANYFTLGLENRLQTKRYDGSGELHSVDLATFLVNTVYRFDMKKNNLAFKEHSYKFDTVNMQLELKPYPWLSSLSKMTVKTKTAAVQTEDIDVSADLGNGNFIGVGQRYEKTEIDNFNQVTAMVKYRINKNWGFNIYERFDILKSFREQEYVLIRDLHCWQIEFTCNIKKDPSDIAFWVVMTLKAFPNYPIGFRKAYSRAEFGPRGGI